MDSMLRLVMRLTFDPEADAAYLYLEEIPPGAAVQNVVVERDGKGDIVLDFDADGYLLGVEVIGAEALVRAATLDKADRL
ncbi:DUF2283 domain-containing protein [Actinoplanes sp. NPDC051859]|uniref:DUF2283 domain-containing protein n=1 Tax=Actinoplanes sp. NPDC051859 TaxID=3363909 RepID=UPI00379BF15E